jgi:hypothetical protein
VGGCTVLVQPDCRPLERVVDSRAPLRGRLCRSLFHICGKTCGNPGCEAVCPCKLLFLRSLQI